MTANRWIVVSIAIFLIIVGGFVYATRSASAEPLEVGTEAPMFATKGAVAGELFDLDLADALADGPVVLYFFPRAFTEGCTIEANMFAEATPDFGAAGATVIGMSADEMDVLSEFSTAECRDQFAVAQADDNVIDAYQVRFGAGLAYTNRTSYVIDRGGKIALVHSSLDPSDHVRLTLAKVRELAAE